jgi:DNA polymerase sigma
MGHACAAYATEMGPAAVGINGGRGGGRRRQQQPRGYKSRKVQLLSKVASELRYQKFADVQLIAHARVPLIKFRDPHTGVNCDVCVGNDGVYKSAVLGAMANLDPRYRDLVFLVKMWAKNFDCNDATAGTFNSFALSLMSLFHLQTRSPPILPPALRLTLVSDAAADADLAAENERAANLEPIRKFPVSKIRQQSDALRDIAPVEQRSVRWQGCGGSNTATLSELLVTFFTHFRAVEPLWRHGLVASTYAGRWVAGSSWAPGRYCLGVEDPFAAGDNVVGLYRLNPPDP